MGLSIGQAIEFGWTETRQDRKVAFGVFMVDLHHTTDEELFFFCRACFPIVGLQDGHGEAPVASPLLTLRLFLILGRTVYVVLDGRELLHWP